MSQAGAICFVQYLKGIVRIPRGELSAEDACSVRTEAERRPNTLPFAAGYLTAMYDKLPLPKAKRRNR